MYGNPLQQKSGCLLKCDQRKGTTKNSPCNRPVDIGENHAAAKHYCGVPMLHHPIFVKVFSYFFKHLSRAYAVFAAPGLDEVPVDQQCHFLEVFAGLVLGNKQHNTKQKQL